MIEEIDVGPQEGEVLLKVVASGVCHTDAFTYPVTTLKARFPAFWATKAVARWSNAAPGVKELKPGDHVIPLYIPECGECGILPLHQNQSVPIHRRHGKGPATCPTTLPLFPKGTPLFHYMGCSTFAEYGGAGNRPGQDQPGRTAG